MWGLYSIMRILLQLFRSRPLRDGTRGVSTTFRDQGADAVIETD
jgi:hypothetical protein